MSKVIPLFGREPETPEGLKMLLSLNRRGEDHLFRTGAQARRFFGACLMPMSEYGGVERADEIAEDILALSHAQHRCAQTTERLVHALVLSIRNANAGEIYHFRLIDSEGAVFMGYADGKSFTLKVASDYQGTDKNGTETFARIHSMEFEISEGQAFLMGQSTEI